LKELSHSPYALSVSFLKDPSILGKDDDMGKLKYALNLDEQLLKDFYENLHLNHIEESYNEDREHLPFNNDIFESTGANIREMIEKNFYDDQENIENR
jgi:hypothetical protein